MFPALRVAWLVVPQPLAARFRCQAELSHCNVPTLWQQTLADFINDGHFWRHLKKCAPATRCAGSGWSRRCRRRVFRWYRSPAGSIGDGGEGDDREQARRCQRAGLAVQALSDWRMLSRGEGGLLMSFTNITSAVMAREVVGELKQALASVE